MRITIIVPELEPVPEVDEALPIPPDEYRSIAKPDSYFVSEGLGTLVNTGDEILLLTHDHWSQFDESLGLVELHNSKGEKLAEMELKDFKKLIRYRDGGTMIVSAPREIEAGNRVNLSLLPGEPLGRQHSVAADRVLLTHRDQHGESRISLIEATIEKSYTKQGKAVVQMQTANGESIAGGDSGGGIWIQGNLAGNMWATIMMENESTGERQHTDRSIAALIPWQARTIAAQL